ncbi:phage portal protein [Cryobacterium sp. 10I1]|uniref:phage portal protein n=1 Tax=unclassified Cryobacterium TaxID=2649013 RepID=UPI002B22F6D5|nr:MULTISPECIES: phage portal protein [unclassified Cryobacterium]MEB0001609.1 phage portal protein [Cryobacterium sp. RTC2.1]MEB0303822.1 phage portal protein [Cryobacterium sp. 10I1]
MSVFFGKGEGRSVGWSDVFGTSSHGSFSLGGLHDQALRVIPVYAAVSLIADQFAMLPFATYRGGLQASQQIATPQFLVKPDPRISVFDWKYQLAVSLKLRGNAYGYLTGSSIRPSGVLWIHPDHITVNETSGTPIYNFYGAQETNWQHGGRIIHLREFVQAGSVKGLSPIAMFRATFETSAYAMKYGNEWFKNSAIPSGILRNEKTQLKPGAAAEAKALFMASTQHKEPVVLDTNWTWQQVSIAPEEAQFLQTIKATATQIAAIFRVSPEDIGGESGNSRTYGNRESDQQVFNIRTLLPLVTRVEEALNEILPNPQFIKFDLEVLSRPNMLERARANTEKLKNGTRTLAEARKGEDAAPLTEAEVEFWHKYYLTTYGERAAATESTTTSIAKTEG